MSICQEAGVLLIYVEITYSPDKKINHKVISVLDSESSDLKALFEETKKFIDKGRVKGNVLVHCMVGRILQILKVSLDQPQ